MMSPATLQILMALADTAMHGLAIRDAIAERTGGDMSLGPGTLYEGIHRMLRDGWVEEATDAMAADGDGRRKYYRLTDSGRAEMEAELGRLDRLVRDARARDLIPEPGEA